MKQSQILSITFVSGLLLTIVSVADAATIHSSFATTMPTAAASDSPPNMLLFTLAGLLAALFCAWRGCERRCPQPAALNGHHPASEPPQN